MKLQLTILSLLLTVHPAAAASLGMKVEHADETNGDVSVTTTGARFHFDQSGTITAWQRIPEERSRQITWLELGASVAISQCQRARPNTR